MSYNAGETFIFNHSLFGCLFGEHTNDDIFSVNSTLYFVKETSLRRLGLKSDESETLPKKNWLLGVLTRMELCQIRKTNNR